MSVFDFLLAENGHFRTFLTPPKTAQKNGSKFFDAFLPKPLILTHFSLTLLEKKKTKLREMRQKIKIERNASKKLDIFFMGYFRGGQKLPQPANKKSKTDIYLFKIINSLIENSRFAIISNSCYKFNILKKFYLELKRLKSEKRILIQCFLLESRK